MERDTVSNSVSQSDRDTTGDAQAKGLLIFIFIFCFLFSINLFYISVSPASPFFFSCIRFDSPPASPFPPLYPHPS